MTQVTRIASLTLLFMLAFTIFPGGAGAQAAKFNTEIVTLQIDASTPTGTHVIGALVVTRSLDTGQATLKFNGTIDGKPASATANATETWFGNGKSAFAITEITSWNALVPKPELITIELSQAGPGVILFNGVPMAASADLVAPGSGNLSYVVTNSGKGEDSITMLPKTGYGSTQSDPLMIAGFLVVIGPLMLLVGVLLSKVFGSARRNTASTGAK